MQSIYELKKVLRRFGTFVYTGNQVADLELMEEEVRELYNWKMIEEKEFQQAILLIRRELRKVKGEQQKK